MRASTSRSRAGSESMRAWAPKMAPYWTPSLALTASCVSRVSRAASSRAWRTRRTSSSTSSGPTKRWGMRNHSASSTRAGPMATPGETAIPRLISMLGSTEFGAWFGSGFKTVVQAARLQQGQASRLHHGVLKPLQNDSPLRRRLRFFLGEDVPQGAGGRRGPRGNRGRSPRRTVPSPAGRPASSVPARFCRWRPGPPATASPRTCTAPAGRRWRRTAAGASLANWSREGCAAWFGNPCFHPRPARKSGASVPMRPGEP